MPGTYSSFSRLRPFLLFFLFFLSFSLLTACSSRPQDNGDDHTMFGEEISNSMRRLKTLIFEREMTAEQVTSRRREMAIDFATLTMELADDLENAGGGNEFSSYAGQLRNNAALLQKKSQTMSSAQLEATFDQVWQTCENCHRAHRVK